MLNKPRALKHRRDSYWSVFRSVRSRAKSRLLDSRAFVAAVAAAIVDVVVLFLVVPYQVDAFDLPTCASLLHYHVLWCVLLPNSVSFCSCGWVL